MGPCGYRGLSFAATHHSIAYWEIVDCTVTRRLGAIDSMRRDCRYATGCRCEEAIAFKALAFLCIVPFESHRGRGRLCGDLGHSGNGARYTCRSKDLISFAAPLCHANGTALLDGRNGRSGPLGGCTDIPHLRQRVLRRA